MSLKETAAPLLERFAAASEDHALTRGRLVAVEAAGSATTEQFAARRLARTHAALTPTQLREALAADGARIPATRLKAAVRTATARTVASRPGASARRPAVGAPAA